MDKKEIFCILHDTKTTQLLIKKTDTHEESSLTTHFWSNGMNGFVDHKIAAKPTGEYPFTILFEELKNLDRAISWANDCLAQVGLAPEITFC